VFLTIACRLWRSVFAKSQPKSVESRLSSELVRLSKLFESAVNGHRETSLYHTELAQFNGTTPSTVSRLLCRWQALEIVNIGRESGGGPRLHGTCTLNEGEMATRVNS
jgi:CRP-like cAMP-binding protein